MYDKIIKPLVIKLYKNSKENTFKSVSTTLRAFCKRNPDIKSLSPHNLIIERILKHKSSRLTKIKQLYMFGSLYRELGNTKAQKAISSQFKKLNKGFNNKLKKNKPKNSSEKKCISTNLSFLRSKLDYTDLDQRSILYSIYVSSEYTPRLELNELIYITSSNVNKNKNKDKNYIYFTSSDECFIVLNKYKTADAYGEWIIPIKNKLKTLLRNYLTSKKGNMEYVFLNKRNKMFPPNKFSEFFTNSFKKIAGKKISSTCLRKIKENDLFHYNSKILNWSDQEKEEYVIKYFRHSNKTADLFYKMQGSSIAKSGSKLSDKDVWNSGQSKDSVYYKKSLAKRRIITSISSDKPNVLPFLNDVYESMQKNNINKKTLKLLVDNIS